MKWALSTWQPSRAREQRDDWTFIPMTALDRQMSRAMMAGIRFYPISCFVCFVVVVWYKCCLGELSREGSDHTLGANTFTRKVSPTQCYPKQTFLSSNWWSSSPPSLISFTCLLGARHENSCIACIIDHIFTILRWLGIIFILILQTKPIKLIKFSKFSSQNKASCNWVTKAAREAGKLAKG